MPPIFSETSVKGERSPTLSRSGDLPRYYFHIEQYGEVVEDPEGTDLPDLEAAREEAIAAARQIISDRVAAGKAANGSIFKILDEQGRIVLRVPFSDAIAAS